MQPPSRVGGVGRPKRQISASPAVGRSFPYVNIRTNGNQEKSRDFLAAVRVRRYYHALAGSITSSAATARGPVMAIRFRCENPNCRKPLRVKDEVAGKRIKCPSCGHSQVVSAADE